jgi:hypothetical protein
MEYLLKYCSGGWCPAYYGQADADSRNEHVKIYRKDELISIPLDHRDLQNWYRRRYRLFRTRGTAALNMRIVDKRPKCVPVA